MGFNKFIQLARTWITKFKGKGNRPQRIVITLKETSLVRAIQEAATWIEKVNFDFETNLYRTPSLTPHTHLLYFHDSEQPIVVEQVVAERSQMLKQAHVELIPVDKLHHYGRIMLFDFNSTVVDGTPQEVSNFYVDVYDTPPIDTWVVLDERNWLLAWVPASQYFYVEEALKVAMLDNFSWPHSGILPDSLNFLEPVFTKPEIVEPLNKSFDLTKRINLMQKFEERLEQGRNRS